MASFPARERDGCDYHPELLIQTRYCCCNVATQQKASSPAQPCRRADQWVSTLNLSFATPSTHYCIQAHLPAVHFPGDFPSAASLVAHMQPSPLHEAEPAPLGTQCMMEMCCLSDEIKTEGHCCDKGTRRSYYISQSSLQS